MTNNNPGRRLLRFGEYEIDSQACELRRAGQRVPLQIQPFRVLEKLVDRAGEVVTRAELRAMLWPTSVYVDFDHGLNNAINRVRHALSDSAEAPEFIETIPRVGYRFVHPLDEPERADAKPAPHVSKSRGATFWAGTAALALVIAVSSGVPILTWRGVTGAPPPGTTGSGESYEAYLRGTKLFEQRSKESLELAVEHFARAVELDPNSAAAQAALAITYSVAAGNNTLVRVATADRVHSQALAAAQRSLELDPGLPEAHLALARVLDALEPQSVAADIAIERSYRRALELDPASANTHLFFGNFLATRARSDESIAHHHRAHELDPLSPSIASRLGMSLIARGEIDAGLEQLRRTVQLDPWQFNARLRLGWAYVAQRDYQAARNEFEAAERISPHSVTSLSGLAFTSARMGDPSRARAMLEEIRPLAEALSSPLDVAIVYVGLEDRANSLEWLGRAARETRSLHMLSPWGLDAPIYDWLRDDERFAQLAREIATSNARVEPIAQAR